MRLLIAAAVGFALSMPAMAQIGGQSTERLPTSSGSAPRGSTCSRGEEVNGQTCSCRRMQTETSSRISYRSVCMLPSEWRALEAR